MTRLPEGVNLALNPGDLTDMLPAPRLVGLSGYAGVGKDEAARFLVRQGYRRVAFADKVRDLALEVHPALPPLVQQVGWEELKRSSDEVREALQRIGAGVRDVLGENAWVNAALADVAPGERVVITDVRYPNEAKAITDRGGKVVRIERPGYGPVNNHVSEVALDGYPFDDVLHNTGTVAELHYGIAYLLGL